MFEGETRATEHKKAFNGASCSVRRSVYIKRRFDERIKQKEIPYYFTKSVETKYTC